MKDYSTKYGSNATVESFSETQKGEETYKIFVGDENSGSDHTSSKTVEESISKIQKIKGEKSMKSLEALENWYNTQSPKTKAYEYEHHYRLIKKDLEQFEVIQKKPTFFDEYMDAEITPLVIALSQLKGIKTYDSCCGHLKEPARVFFKCNNFDSLAIIGRAFDDRYSDGKWSVKIATQDEEEEGFPTLCIYIESKKPFDNWEEMFKSVNDCSYNINYWKENFKKENNILENIEVEETTSD